MANIFCDGFDQYSTGQLIPSSTYIVSDNNFVTDEEEIGTGKSARVGGFGVLCILTDEKSELIIGSRILYTSNPASATYCAGVRAWINSSTSDEGLTFGIGLNGAPTVRLGNSIIYQGQPETITNVSYYLEAHFYRDRLVGYINGVQKCDISFTDLGSNFIAAGFGSFSAGAKYFDDLYINDTTSTENNDRLGEISVFTLFPDADTADANWTLNGGTTGFGILDNVGPDAAQYLSTDVPATSTFDIAGFPVEVFQIYNVVTNYYADKSSSASAEMRTNIIQDATTGNGPTSVLAENTPQYFRDNFPLDPATGLNWNPATFAPQIQLERTA